MAMECPRLVDIEGEVTLAHGEGARATRELLRDVVLPALGEAAPQVLDDAAPVGHGYEGKLLVTTDSYVVSPYRFPGGDIGSLAVHGSLNDLAVCGARPVALTVGLILEEGFPLRELVQVLQSAARAASRWEVRFHAGDTKVVPRGACDRIFVNTTAVGVCPSGVRLGFDRVRPGDAILVSGTIAEHGMAVMAVREGFGFGGDLVSDSGPVYDAVQRLLSRCSGLRFLRDPTRGGVAAVLHEVAQATGFTLTIDEDRVPVREPVRAACELLGLDPLYVACEGRFVAFVAPDQAELAVSVLRGGGCSDAAFIGVVQQWRGAPVLVRTPLGPERVLDEPKGSPLPRIC